MRMLLVEDSEDLSRLLTEGLSRAGFESDAVMTARDASLALARTRYGAVILDLGLPDGEGIDVLRETRQRSDSTPVLILTARASVKDRTVGLDSGADDYLVKPFALEELVSRLRAILRRPGQLLGMSLRAGNVTLDTERRQVFIDDRPSVFTAREIAVLEVLMRSLGRVVPKQAIADQLGNEFAQVRANAVEVYVHRLRTSLAETGATANIHTVYGVGYMLADEAR
jgi:DNA-binding response OmpR family regulator